MIASLFVQSPKGAAQKSFGIQVAKMAGLPDNLIQNAKDKLATLSIGKQGKKTKVKTEISTKYVQNPAIDVLGNIDVDDLSPKRTLVLYTN